MFALEFIDLKARLVVCFTVINKLYVYFSNSLDFGWPLYKVVRQRWWKGGRKWGKGGVRHSSKISDIFVHSKKVKLEMLSKMKVWIESCNSILIFLSNWPDTWSWKICELWRLTSNKINFCFYKIFTWWLNKCMIERETYVIELGQKLKSDIFCLSGYFFPVHISQTLSKNNNNNPLFNDYICSSTS